MTIVTRIAPSPTGEMHLGTARTALYNYLYAKRMGGKMLLRIEDTDKERSTPENIEVIYDGLRWIGIPFDDEPVLQSTRAPRHVDIVMSMLADGTAYRCYLTPDEADALKTKGTAFRSPWRDASPDLSSGAPFVVRFKGPLTGKTVVKDLIRGDVEFDNTVFDDMVLLRTDGTPTYNLAVVVDDHDMGVNHVIRGDDHLNNAARQSLLYAAIGWDVPVYAHMPLIYGPDGKKLSKRWGASSVMEFRDKGYLPEAMRNYMARLGWGHGDDEIFSDADAISWFDIADVVKSPARVDYDKLDFVNQHYMGLADDSRLADLVTPILFDVYDLVLDHSDRDKLLITIGLIKGGAKNVVKLAEMVRFALLKDVVPDEKTVALLADPVNKDRLARMHALLRTLDWNVGDLNTAIRAFVANEGVTMKDVGPMVRGVLTGLKTAPDIGICLVSIGRWDSMTRIAEAAGVPEIKSLG